jgi:hypothetical protein
MSIAINLTEDHADLLLVALSSRVEQLRAMAYHPENEGIWTALLDMSDQVETLRRDVLAQSDQVETLRRDVLAQVTQPTLAEIEAEQAEEDAYREAEAEAEYYAEVIAPMIAAERAAEAAAARDEAIWGRDEF